MPTRRKSITLIGAAALLATLHNAAAQSAAPATGFVKTTTDQLLAIVNSADPLPAKRRRLRDVIAASVDLDGIGRFCLGRAWRAATPDQQAQYLAAFRAFLPGQIGGHLGEYQGVRVTMGATRPADATQVVTTTVERPGLPADRVDWVVGGAAGAPRIIDLIADGTSMRVTQASDFASYLAHHQYNLPALIEAIRQKAAPTT